MNPPLPQNWMLGKQLSKVMGVGEVLKVKDASGIQIYFLFIFRQQELLPS